MGQTHTFQRNPKGVMQTTTINQAGASETPSTRLPNTRASELPNHIQPSPGSTFQKVFSTVTQTRFQLQDMLPPRKTPTVLADAESDVQDQTPSWVDTTRWPAKTESFIKELAHKHALYASPTNKESHGKLCAIFDEFYNKTDFRTLKPPKHDERLWQLFRVKLDQIQNEMLERGVTVKRSDGTIKRAAILPPTKVLTINTPESLASPLATPVLRSDKHRKGIELWNGLDVDAQAALFRHQLRNAKNQKGLVLEWNEYCAEVREKRGHNKSRDPKSATPSERSSSLTTPPAPILPPVPSLPSLPSIPPLPSIPQSPGNIDVKQIIENKLRELELKRNRERGEASEERAAKRLKEDPA